MTLQQMKYAIMVADCGSLNEAAKQLFISQPSLSGAVKELEAELGMEIFFRSNRGVKVTPAGEEFLGYAKQVTEQYRLLEDRFINKRSKQKFSVSAQHYTFAVKAFSELVKEVGIDEYEFAFYETRTYDIMENVRNFKSELGILYVDDFNEKVIRKLLADNSLEFYELFTCDTYAYISKAHPLADQEEIAIAELEEYPCLSFDQGNNHSFYLAEEVMSAHGYKRLIKVSDRATVLNLMVALNGYTLCSGIICEELNGAEHRTVKLKGGTPMRIGYICRRDSRKSMLAKRYLELLKE